MSVCLLWLDNKFQG